MTFTFEYRKADDRCLTPCPYRYIPARLRGEHGSPGLVYCYSFVCQKCEFYVGVRGRKLTCNHPEKETTDERSAMRAYVKE